MFIIFPDSPTLAFPYPSEANATPEPFLRRFQFSGPISNPLCAQAGAVSLTFLPCVGLLFSGYKQGSGIHLHDPNIEGAIAMMPTFHQMQPDAGVDENIPTGGAGIIVPLNGENIVALADGPAHKVVSTQEPAVHVDEITDPRTHPVWTKLLPILNPNLKSGAIRIFNIKGNSLIGLDVVKVQATKASPKRVSKVEATLKVLVLKQKLVKIAIRAAQVRDDQGNNVSFTNTPINVAQSLIDEMNSIWEPQANVHFQLVTSDAVLIDGLSPQSQGADIQKSPMFESFQSNKDPGAHFTMFLVRRAFDGGTGVKGVTNSKAGFALIGDDRSERTMAHEAGHFLGSLNEAGNFSQRYGHQGTDAGLLMADGAPGRKIPYGLVPDFNKGYRREHK